MHIRRLLIKIGTGVFRSLPGGIPDVCATVARQVAAVEKQGVETVLVSSGAIFTAEQFLKERRFVCLADKPALASIGQPILMEHWSAAFLARDILVSQVLVTDANLMHRIEWDNTKRVIEECAANGIVPVINENDAVSFEEYVTDNDNLTALLAPALKADAVQFVTAVGGVCTGVPGKSDTQLYLEIDAERPPKVDQSVSENGRGGMAIKIACAQKCLKGGAWRVGITGLSQDIIMRFAAGEIVPTTIGKANRLLES